MPSTKRNISRTVALVFEDLPGVNIRAPWAQQIVEGKKTVETRFYPMPAKYTNRPIFLVETPGRSGSFKSRIVGIAVFGRSFPYEGADQFYADSARHLVGPQSTDVNWESGRGKAKWGWPVLRIIKFNSEIPPATRRGIKFASVIRVRVPVAQEISCPG